MVLGKFTVENLTHLKKNQSIVTDSVLSRPVKVLKLFPKPVLLKTVG